MESDPSAFAFCNALQSSLHAGQGITCARRQNFDVQVDRQILCPQQIVENLTICDFGFALAAKKNWPLWWYYRTASHHPMCGTAP